MTIHELIRELQKIPNQNKEVVASTESLAPIKCITENGHNQVILVVETNE